MNKSRYFMDTKNINYYMVRTHDTDENYINIGWGKVNLADCTTRIDTIKDQICNIYLSNSSAITIGRTLNQIKRFIDIKKDDVIVIPHGNSIRIATVKNKIYKNNEFGNIIEVDFSKDKNGKIRSVARTQLTEKLQRRLRVRGCTVANYQEFATEIIRVSSTDNYSYESDVESQIEQEINQFKSSLLDRIRKGETHLQGGGIGLERLIQELLEIDGYDEVRILSKSTYKGKADADIIAHKSDVLIGDTYTLIQVKHHNGITDKHGIDQLIEISNRNKYYYDHKVLITSAELTDETKHYADENNIKVIQGNDLIDWIYDDLDKLSPTTRVKLGVSIVPKFI